MTTCVKCGANLSDGAKYCTECGTRQYAEPVQDFQQSQAQQPQQTVLNMKDNKYAKAKYLILAPLVVFTLIAVCFVISLVMNVPISSTNVVFRFCHTISFLGALLSPLPCLVMTVVGTVIAGKAKKEGLKEYRVFFTIGMIEIIATVLFVLIGGAFLMVIAQLV